MRFAISDPVRCYVPQDWWLKNGSKTFVRSASAIHVPLSVTTMPTKSPMIHAYPR
jgi:hypothetical protein